MGDHEQSLEEKFISFVETPQEISQLMVKLISHPPKSTILDTGCGKGIFLNSLIEAEYTNLEGIEINSQMCDSLKASYPNVVLHNENFLKWNVSNKYDVIIGNPPYSHYNSLPADIQEDVFDLTNTAESDIYYAFLIKAIEVLKENGELIYIVPYQFFYNTHAEVVRRKILESGFIDTLIDLGEARIFRGELPETIIIKFIKTENRTVQKIKVLRIKKKTAKPEEILDAALKALVQGKENDLFHCYKKNNFTSSEEIWSSHPRISLAKYVRLGDVAFIGVGLVTGFDEAFRIKNDEINAFNEKEKDLIINLVKAVNCKGYWVEGFERYILIDKRIKDEAQLSEDYPNMYERIIKFKGLMEDRYLPGHKKWFHWQALRNKVNIEKYFELPKIFVPGLDRSLVNRFSISNEDIYPSGDVLIIIPLKIDPLFLLGYLNSDFFREYYLSHGAKKGQRIAFMQRIMANIKIPVFNDELIKEIKNITKKILDSRIISEREKIDKIITNTLGNFK